MISIEDITADPPGEGVVVDPMAWFASRGPFELEIGCGKGGFLLSRAKDNPDIRMLGIEWANKYYRYAADRMARWQLTNVRVMRTDATHFVANHLPPGCVSVLHVYHPDPWPKKRHHKRRLFQPRFVADAIRALAPGGKWLFQSDHDEYFAEAYALLSAQAELTETDWDALGVAPGPEWQGTNFEIKFARAGSSIHRAAYIRQGTDSD